MLARELSYHYSGNSLFSDLFLIEGRHTRLGNADCKSVNTIMNQRFVEYSLFAPLKNTSDVATILWCLGKTTRKCFSPDEVIQNGRDHARQYPSAKQGGMRGAINALESGAKPTLSKKDIPFEFKYTNFKYLQADNATKSFWTDAEEAEEKQEQLNKENKMLTLSRKGWSLRLFHAERKETGKQLTKYCPLSCQIL